MEELSSDELDQVMRAPQPKARKSKNFERSIHTWFFDIVTVQGTCDNPECTDPRKKHLVYVWEHSSGARMCRFCFFAGWEPHVED
jgi:hypothetical protein